MGKASLTLNRNAGWLSSTALEIIKEISLTKNNIANIHMLSLKAHQDNHEIGEKIAVLKKFFEKNKAELTEKEIQITLNALLVLFLIRDGKLKEAASKLNEI